MLYARHSDARGSEKLEASQQMNLIAELEVCVAGGLPSGWRRVMTGVWFGLLIFLPLLIMIQRAEITNTSPLNQGKAAIADSALRPRL